MNILADENIDANIVVWLRQEGHDVVWMVEETRGAKDEEILHQANSARRILLTNDLDFCELAFLRGEASAGVILLPLRFRSPEALLAHFQESWKSMHTLAHNHFVVVSNDRIRIRQVKEEPSQTCSRSWQPRVETRGHSRVSMTRGRPGRSSANCRSRLRLRHEH